MPPHANPKLLTISAEIIAAISRSAGHEAFMIYGTLLCSKKWLDNIEQQDRTAGIYAVECSPLTVLDQLEKELVDNPEFRTEFVAAVLGSLLL